MKLCLGRRWWSGTGRGLELCRYARPGNRPNRRLLRRLMSLEQNQGRMVPRTLWSAWTPFGDSKGTLGFPQIRRPSTNRRQLEVRWGSRDFLRRVHLGPRLVHDTACSFSGSESDITASKWYPNNFSTGKKLKSVVFHIRNQLTLFRNKIKK